MWPNLPNISNLIVETFHSVGNLVFHFQVAIKLHTQTAHTRCILNSMTGYCNVYVARQTVTLLRWEENDHLRFFLLSFNWFLVKHAATQLHLRQCSHNGFISFNREVDLSVVSKTMILHTVSSDNISDRLGVHAVECRAQHRPFRDATHQD